MQCMCFFGWWGLLADCRHMQFDDYFVCLSGGELTPNAVVFVCICRVVRSFPSFSAAFTVLLPVAASHSSCSSTNIQTDTQTDKKHYRGPKRNLHETEEVEQTKLQECKQKQNEGESECATAQQTYTHTHRMRSILERTLS